MPTMHLNAHVLSDISGIEIEVEETNTSFIIDNLLLTT